MRKLITLAVFGLGSVAVPLVATSGAVTAARPVCHDSNGPRPGGSVYVDDGAVLRCDVVHGQRLHVLHVRSRAACDDMGGHGWTRATRICWDVDF